MLDDGFIEMHTYRKANDAVVVYFKDGVPAHFGKFENDLVIIYMFFWADSRWILSIRRLGPPLRHSVGEGAWPDLDF